jgi:4-amino-4-deoxy-L-arabinose transferase-like glycosyltransferase
MSTLSLPHPRSRRRGALGAGRLRGLVRGRAGDPAWVRPALLGLLAAAAVMYLYKLTASGYSNTYYAAAVKSASVSLKAWFFGSLDPGSFITVDKPPLSIWLMGLSARIFGFSSSSLLLPQALCTLGTVGLLFATVRRAFGPVPGLLAAGMLVLSPITLALARVDMPDPLLVLLLVASPWATMRGVESGRTRHLVWAGVFVGLAFMTKMLQGWMVVPALAASYLLAGRPRLAVRLGQLALAGAAMVVVSAAWPLAVSLWPGSAPYVGGSTDGSVWDLILGYNGFGRLTGEGGGMGAGFGGVPSVWRLFNAQVGGQIAWLLPLAAVSLLAGLWLTRKRPRTDLARAGWVLFGLWAIVHVAVFSAQAGTFHPYYVSALAPAVAALSAAGLVALLGWAARSAVGMAALAVGVVGSALEAMALLGDYASAVRAAIAVAAVIAVLALLVPSRVVRRVGALAAVIAVLAGPAAYTTATVGRSLNGDNVTAGPASSSVAGGLAVAGGRPTLAGGAPGASESATADAQLIAYLTAHQGGAKYLVAAAGSRTTAPIIIATGKPVVTIGGFTGSDPAPTTAQLAAMVEAGELKYVLLSGDGGGPGAFGGRSSSSAITAWVKAHGTVVSGVSSTSGTLYAVHA